MIAMSSTKVATSVSSVTGISAMNDYTRVVLSHYSEGLLHLVSKFLSSRLLAKLGTTPLATVCSLGTSDSFCKLSRHTVKSARYVSEECDPIIVFCDLLYF